MVSRVSFVALLFFISVCGSVRAEDCGLRGCQLNADGEKEIVKIDCEPVAGSSSPVRIRTPTGIWAVKLTNPPGDTKFRVRLSDGTIKAFGSGPTEIRNCEELQMIGAHPAYPFDGNYRLAPTLPDTSINCSATNPADPKHAASLWGKGYDARYGPNGFDGIAGTADDPAVNNPKLARLSKANLAFGFQPLGLFAGEQFPPYFSGQFDGADVPITGLFINRGDTGFIGLFGILENARVSNVYLVNGWVKGASAVGALAGRAVTSPVASSKSDVDVEGSSGSGAIEIGGLIGGSVNSVITECSSSGKVTGESYVGGLIGKSRLSSSIINSSATGEVNAKSAFTNVITAAVGGLVGENYQSNVSHCYSRGLIKITSSEAIAVGGLVGFNLKSSTIENSYSLRNLSVVGTLGDHSGGVGGFVGQNGSVIRNAYATGNVTIGQKSGTNSFAVGGFVGFNKVGTSSGTLQNCFATGTVTTGAGLYSVGGLAGVPGTEQNSWWFNTVNPKGIGFPLALGNKADGFSDFYSNGTNPGKKVYTDAPSPWDFTTVWEPVSGKYPVLRGVDGPQDK